MKRQIRIEGDLAYIPLTLGYEAVIDAADVSLVDKWNWCALVTPWSVYAKRSVRTGPKSRSILLHRVLMGEPTGLEVDHRCGNGLNNCRNNLRIATNAQNQHNQRTSIRNSLGLKGVGWHKASGKWRSTIMLHGKRKHLGLFDTPEAAHAAYAEASAELHGEFGRVA